MPYAGVVVSGCPNYVFRCLRANLPCSLENSNKKKPSCPIEDYLSSVFVYTELQTPLEMIFYRHFSIHDSLSILKDFCNQVMRMCLFIFYRTATCPIAAKRRKVNEDSLDSRNSSASKTRRVLEKKNVSKANHNNDGSKSEKHSGKNGNVSSRENSSSKERKERASKNKATKNAALNIANKKLKTASPQQQRIKSPRRGQADAACNINRGRSRKKEREPELKPRNKRKDVVAIKKRREDTPEIDEDKKRIQETEAALSSLTGGIGTDTENENDDPLFENLFEKKAVEKLQSSAETITNTWSEVITLSGSGYASEKSPNLSPETQNESRMVCDEEINVVKQFGTAEPDSSKENNVDQEDDGVDERKIEDKEIIKGQDNEDDVGNLLNIEAVCASIQCIEGNGADSKIKVESRSDTQSNLDSDKENVVDGELGKGLEDGSRPELVCDRPEVKVDIDPDEEDHANEEVKDPGLIHVTVEEKVEYDEPENFREADEDPGDVVVDEAKISTIKVKCSSEGQEDEEVQAGNDDFSEEFLEPSDQDKATSEEENQDYESDWNSPSQMDSGEIVSNAGSSSQQQMKDDFCTDTTATVKIETGFGSQLSEAPVDKPDCELMHSSYEINQSDGGDMTGDDAGLNDDFSPFTDDAPLVIDESGPKSQESMSCDQSPDRDIDDALILPPAPEMIKIELPYEESASMMQSPFIDDEISCHSKDSEFENSGTKNDISYA